MGNMNKSASKIVFLALTFTVCVAFLYEVYVGRVTLDSDQFLTIASPAFTYYFLRNAYMNNQKKTGTDSPEVVG